MLELMVQRYNNLMNYQNIFFIKIVYFVLNTYKPIL